MVDACAVGGVGMLVFVPERLCSFMEQVPAVCQELDKRYSQPSLNRHEHA
jgi:hypothetical protein